MKNNKELLEKISTYMKQSMIKNFEGKENNSGTS